MRIPYINGMRKAMATMLWKIIRGERGSSVRVRWNTPSWTKKADPVRPCDLK